MKIDPKENWVWHWARGTSKNVGFPFIISATAETNDFKFAIKVTVGKLLGFGKARDKNTP